jgi:hypothetical protein
MEHDISYSEFLSFNPSVNNDCSNLLSSTNVCVGLPGPAWNGTTIDGSTVTKTSEHATSTAAVPSNAAFGSTHKCGQWYSINDGDYCELVAINSGISLALFTAINPSIDSSCGNLKTGLAYCVWPAMNWNSTGVESPVSLPTTTPSNTASICYQWYIIQSNDDCYKLVPISCL